MRLKAVPMTTNHYIAPVLSCLTRPVAHDIRDRAAESLRIRPVISTFPAGENEARRSSRYDVSASTAENIYVMLFRSPVKLGREFQTG